MLAPLLLAALLATSPWSPAEWRININIGREPGTYMPDEWGASGARLSLPLEVRIDSDREAGGDTERDFMGGGSCQMTVLEDPTFVSNKGEEQVIFKDDGAWKMRVDCDSGWIWIKIKRLWHGTMSRWNRMNDCFLLRIVGEKKKLRQVCDDSDRCK
jgi:hypothetical protein